MRGPLDQVLVYGRTIRFSHSVFALPFALAAVLFASREGAPGAGQIAWVVVAMVAARSAAMGWNRLVDRELDSRNPRTAGRELPRGVLTPRQAFVFVVVSAGALVLAAGMLNPLCLMLSPLALAIVLGYSHTKRFTSLSHVVLGLSLALGPVGAWLAIRGSLAPLPLLLGLAVLLWVAGFDTIYACQDAEFDRREGLHSLPARLGVARALFVARGLHLGAWVALGALFWLQPLHSIYLLGVVAIGLLLVFEHSLVSAADQSRVMQAFNLNGWVSLGYLAVAAVAVWWA